MKSVHIFHFVAVGILFIMVAKHPCLAAEDLTQMNLDELIKYAEENNPSIAAARQNIPIAQAHVEIVGTRSNPQIAYSQSFIGGIPGSEGGSTEYAPNISFDLDFFGKRSQRKVVAEKNLEAEKLSFDNFRRQFRLTFRNTYRQYLLLSQQLKATSEFYESYKDLLVASEVRAKTGDISGVEYSRLELERIAFEVELQATAIHHRETSNQLNYLLGLPPQEKAIQLKGKLEFEPLSVLGVSLTDRTPSKRPDLLELKTLIEKFHSESILKRREAFPTLSIGGEYRKKGQEGYLGFSISLPIPIFDRRQGEIQSAEESAKKLTLEAQAKEREIALEVQSKQDELRLREQLLTRFEQLNLLEKNREVAEKSRFAYLKRAYSMVQLLEAQRNYFTVIKSYYEQLFLYYNAVDKYLSSASQGEST